MNRIPLQITEVRSRNLFLFGGQWLYVGHMLFGNLDSKKRKHFFAKENKMRREIILILSIIVLTVSFMGNSAMAAANSNVEGYVRDAQTKDPLPGANVMLKGTSLGASTDLNGRYVIRNVPPGSYIIRAAYIGYKNEEVAINVKESVETKQDFKLEAVGVQGKTVVVTGQASGQNAAINQQLSSNRIMNSVSAARIQELPDANAAESVGRLPGVSLIREGGEGASIVIRGLAPQYNQILIDGVQMAATDVGDRGTDLSMISSNMLEGIEVYKTVTPDMDAAVLGGVVNFQLREAKQNATGGPEIGLLTQGGYNGLQNAYSDYKSVGSIGDRFFDKRFGVFAQIDIERINLTSNSLGGAYDLSTKVFGKPNPTILDQLNLTDHPRNRERYDATVVMDYKLPRGKLDLMNFLSRSNTMTQSRGQSYDLVNSQIDFIAASSPNTLNVITNLLDYEQTFSVFKMDVRLSHSYSENISPNNWSITFLQSSAGLSTVPRSESPRLIGKTGLSKINPNNMFVYTTQSDNGFSRQRNVTGSVDFESNINFSDLITSILKFGGKFRYTDRSYNYDQGNGDLYLASGQDLRAAIIRAFPWMGQAPYNLKADGTVPLPITVFEDPSFSYGKFLNGNYGMGPATNFGILSQLMDISKKYGTLGAYSSNAAASITNDYSGNEYENAGYIMATVNIGPDVTVVPGVRYQGLLTSYTAPRGVETMASQLTYTYHDTTFNEYHGYWLPDVSIRCKPLSWFDVRLAYTNTLSYPDFATIVPRIDIGVSNSVAWNNYALKPAHSQNYDLYLSFYDNSIGLLTAGGFLKQINDLIFPSSSYITDPSLYPGLPGSTGGYQLSTYINDPYRVDVWGTELDWQTHFWYLPGPLSGIVLNVNYTHIFSGAKYPYTLTVPGVYPTYIPTHVDTFYTDRLLYQPNDIANLSVGYDYEGFSVRVSMIYQANVFNQANFWPELRADKAKYLRWDLSAKQDLPWFGLEAFFDLNNINGESDIYVIHGSGFPQSEQDYGMTADLGLRWSLR